MRGSEISTLKKRQKIFCVDYLNYINFCFTSSYYIVLNTFSLHDVLVFVPDVIVVFGRTVVL